MRSIHQVGTSTVRSIPSIMSAAILLLGGLASFFVALVYERLDFHLVFFAVAVGLVSVGLFALTLRGLLRTPEEVAEVQELSKLSVRSPRPTLPGGITPRSILIDAALKAVTGSKPV